MRKILASFLIAIGLFTTIPAVASYGVQTKIKGCTANQVLPDSACTPGAVLTTNVKIICKTGYTKTVRSVSLKTRKQVFAEYGILYSQSGKYEVDHLISLELGGSNDISNLWPESYNLTNSARIKDKFENYLHAQVCNGKMTITQAQKEISSNWLQYYQKTITPPKTTKPAPVKKSVVSQPPLVAPITNQAVQPSNTQPAVKKSTTGICHEKGTTYYDQTTKYTPYNSISDCITSGGRLPNR